MMGANKMVDKKTIKILIENAEVRRKINPKHL